MLVVVVIAISILVYRYDQPMKINPDPDWESTISSLGVTREHVFIQSDDVKLESDLLIPAGGWIASR